MSTKIDLTGKKFGKLYVLREDGRIRKEAAWLCACSCGNTVRVAGYNLRSGHTQSCGCLITEKAREANLIHGLYHARIHQIYTNMKTRCYNKNYYLFQHYGGKGITICPEWLGKYGLLAFWNWSKENGYDDTKTIDRIDNNKGYSPDNCRWATMKEQQNNRTNNRVFNVCGMRKTMKQWSEFLNVSYGTLQRKAKQGKAETFLKGRLNAST